MCLSSDLEILWLVAINEDWELNEDVRVGSLAPLNVGWQCGSHMFSTVGFS